jgi:hypothetical protein
MSRVLSRPEILVGEEEAGGQLDRPFPECDLLSVERAPRPAGHDFPARVGDVDGEDPAGFAVLPDRRTVDQRNLGATHGVRALPGVAHAAAPVLVYRMTVAGEDDDTTHRVATTTGNSGTSDSEDEGNPKRLGCSWPPRSQCRGIAFGGWVAYRGLQQTGQSVASREPGRARPNGAHTPCLRGAVPPQDGSDRPRGTGHGRKRTSADDRGSCNTPDP